jgi:hypothetical protein
MSTTWEPAHKSYRLPGAKILTDADASKINFSAPVETTITAMLAWPLPEVWPTTNRLAPYETTIWLLGHGKSRVVLRAIAVENDGDLKGYLHDLRFPSAVLLGVQQQHKADAYIHAHLLDAQKWRGAIQNWADEKLLASYGVYADVGNIYKSLEDLMKARLVEQECARRNAARNPLELHFEIPAIPNIDPSSKHFELLSAVRKNAEKTWYPEGVPTTLGGKTINQLVELQGIGFADGVHPPGWFEIHPLTGFHVLGPIPKGGQ